MPKDTYIYILSDQVNRISEVTREALLGSKQTIVNKPRILLLLKLNRTLPNITKIIDER